MNICKIDSIKTIYLNIYVVLGEKRKITLLNFTSEAQPTIEPAIIKHKASPAFFRINPVSLLFPARVRVRWD